MVGALLLSGFTQAQTKNPAANGFRAADLFQVTNVWNVHLRMTEEQWKAMEPKGGPGGFFGGPGGGPIMRGLGGPGGLGAPGGPGFGLAMLVAPAFLKGDQNQDGKLSHAEFSTLAETWFAKWDQDQSGKLNAEQLRAGVGSIVTLPGFGPPGPGGPGGPGGRGPGLNLQGAEGKRNGLSAAMGVEFDYVHGDLEFEGITFTNVAIRYKGNGTFMQSRGSLKRSFKVDLNEFVKGQHLAGVSKLNFHNNVTDPGWMNEVMSHQLFRDAGVPAPRTAYARVLLTVPGMYDKKLMGLYSVVENIDKSFAEERFDSKKGALFKPVTPRLFADLGSDWSNYKQTYDPKTEVSKAQTSRVIDLARLVTKAGDDEFASRIGEYLDLDEFARFMAVTVWLSTMDSILGPGQNYYVYLHPKTRKFQFMPWDLDHSFGQFGMMGSQEMRENLSIHRPWMGENRFLERVFRVESFKKLYLARMSEFSKTIFKPERFHQQVDQIAKSIRPVVLEESEEKLARFDKVVAGETVTPAGFGGFGGNRGDGPRFSGPGPGPGGFGQQSKPIKGFVTARADAIAAQLAGKSEGQNVGGAPFGGPRAGGGPPGDFGPGQMLGNVFMTALDTHKDSVITREEFTQGFAKWFEDWNTDKSGMLTEEQLRAGINKDLSPFRGGGGGFGPGRP